MGHTKIECCNCTLCIEHNCNHSCSILKTDVHEYWFAGICNEDNSVPDNCPLKGPDLRYKLYQNEMGD